MTNIINNFGEYIYNITEEFGKFTLFLIQVIKNIFIPPYRIEQLILQGEFIGVNSWGIVTFTGFFTGMVIALQSSYALDMFGAQYLVGPSTILTLTREMGPVLTALMVAGRAGSAMATEIGTMKVTEQIDALFTMSIDPINFLIVPRVVATALLLPLLTFLFDAVGMFGAHLISVARGTVTGTTFWEQIFLRDYGTDLNGGLIKAIFFGILIAVVSSYQGFESKGGAKGVGLSSTKAVVYSSIGIMIADYFLTLLVF